MIFRARLRRQSSVWHLWKNHNRLGGVLLTVQFHRAGPNDFVTDDLEPQQVARLRGHEAVLLEVTTNPIPVVPVPIESPQPEPTPQFSRAPLPAFVPPAVQTPVAREPSIAERRAERLRRGRNQRASFSRYDDS